VLCPVADGGDGTLDVLVAAAGTNARYQEVVVTGPLGRRRRARLGWVGETVAVVEMAEAVGLRLLPAGRRRPLQAGSRGAGELIRAALDGGARRVIVGVGGSASTDGGTGILIALGARLLDAHGRELPPGGGALRRAVRLDLSGLDQRLATTRIDVAVDVRSPLFGPTGAAAVFAPQKGATLDEVVELDEGLRRWAAVAEGAGALPGTDLLEGAGAAGGSGFALAVVGARLVPGAALVCDETGLDAALPGAGVVITGEGRLDSQTSEGKAPAEVARRSARAGLPCVAVCGSVAGGADAFTATIALDDLAAEPRRRVRSLLRRAAALAIAAVEAGDGQP
jgi:glycerate kinase